MPRPKAPHQFGQGALVEAKAERQTFEAGKLHMLQTVIEQASKF